METSRLLSGEGCVVCFSPRTGEREREREREREQIAFKSARACLPPPRLAPRVRFGGLTLGFN